MANSNTTYGLTVGDSKEPVPLKKLEVRTEIQGFIASTTYTLTYENEEDKPVEASFVFPMDDASALFHFEAEIEGRRIVAECQDKEQAKQTYDDAMEAGKSAFLVAESEQSRDIFKCDVGNLPPKTSALVRMSYVTELDLQADGAVLYVFPVTIFDRYELRPEDQGTSRSLKRAKLARGEIPYELDFQLKALSPREISKVEFVDTRDEKEANSDYGQEDAKYYAQTRIAGNFHWDHDVSIKVHYSDPFEPHVVAEKGKPDGEGILKDDMVMLNFFPNLEGEGTRFSKAELVFVMDRSGSMNGDNIEHAKQALLECLKILPDECTFNIVSFGSTHTKMFPRQSRKVNAKNIEEAKKEVKIMTANMGGTEILQPLKDIMSSDATDEYPRQVFLFTDGGVSNSDGVISFIKENAHTTRVFTFGIGQGVSTSLVKRSAHAGKGKYVLVKDTKDLPTLAAQTLKCAMQPNVDDVTITFTPSVDPTFFPKVLPPIFSGERLIAYAVLRKASKDKLEASLKGKVNGRLVHHSLKFSLTDTASELAPVHRLGAKAAIKQMEEDEDWQENKANIIIMSTAANVVSKYTAFIGVDHEGQTMQEAAVKRPLPVPVSPQYAPTSPSYGGGSFDSSMAEFYLTKNFSDVSPAITPSLGLGKTETDKKENYRPFKFDEADCAESSMDEDETSSCASMEEDESTSKTPTEELTPCSMLPLLQCNEEIPIMEESQYDQEYQPCRVTKCVLFAPWTKGAWYPIQSITSSCYTKYQATFKDGHQVKVREEDIVSAAVLSVGDVIGLYDSSMDVYDTAVILEYVKALDSFVVIRHNGQVEWSSANNMMIPANLVKEMKTRKEPSLKQVIMCQCIEKGQDSIILTTSDISELREDGWITDKVVDFFASYLRQEVLSANELKVSHIFPVEFSAHLFAEEDDSIRCGRLGRLHTLYDLVWPWLRKVNLKEKQVLFVPVFDEIHWYLIVVYIEDKHEEQKRISFEIMDSYFQYTDQDQIRRLSSVLKMLATEQCLESEVTSVAVQRNTPVQANENDCGICMLQCLVQCYKDDLYPKPNENWFEKGSELRQDISRLAMKLYWQQKK